jgi:hypothetical protein
VWESNKIISGGQVSSESPAYLPDFDPILHQNYPPIGLETFFLTLENQPPVTSPQALTSYPPTPEKPSESLSRQTQPQRVGHLRQQVGVQTDWLRVGANAEQENSVGYPASNVSISS